jgi:Uma2 family endonuclease
MAPPQGLGWLPLPRSLYRLSVEQYEAIVASGVFKKRDRIQLINGLLVTKMTEYPPHSAVCEASRLEIDPLLPTGWHIRNDRPLRIPNYASVPEPDIVVVRGTWRDYASRHPEPPDAAFIVEVSDSSLYEDRGMADIYAAAGIAAYWIINLVDRQVELHTDPSPTGYRSRQVLTPGQSVPVVVDGVEVGRIDVNDIMP